MGSIGFSFYQTSCIKNNIVSYSFKNVGCCCKKGNVATTGSKSCCSATKKSCCSASACDTEIVKNNCCNSQSVLYKILVSPYNNLGNTIFINTDAVLLSTIKKINFSDQFSTRVNENHSRFYGLPPPLSNFDRRIFIQSFQI